MKRRSRFRMIVGLVLTFMMLSFASISAAGKGDKPKEPKAKANEKKLHPKVKKAAEDRDHDQDWVNVIVTKMPGADEQAIAASTGGIVLKSWPAINAVEFRIQEDSLAELSNRPEVAFVSPDSEMKVTGGFDPNKVAGHYQAALNMAPFWKADYTGAGVGVAVIDSGVAAHPDLADHTVNVVLPGVDAWEDGNGHGTHVAGIIAGANSDKKHLGIAPDATIYNLRVTDAQGNAKESDVISALDWILQNHVQNNIRVVNISMQSTISNSYKSSPLDGMVERLWFDGVVVVVSAGNKGAGTNTAWYPPANDPFVITVGAMDDYTTNGRGDDQVVTWSSQGVTQDGFTKPDILAPGRRILSTLAPGSVLGQHYANQVVDGQYIALSGSSMAAPTIAGAVATMLQAQPALTPNEVKGALLGNHRGALNGQSGAETPTPDMGKVLNAIKDPKKLPDANKGLTPSTFADTSYDVTALNIYYDNIYYDNIYYTNQVDPNMYDQ